MARPDETLVRLYHLPLVDVPDHGPNTARYPAPRKRRGPPPTEEELAAGFLPGDPSALGAGALRGIAWPFHAQCNANTRTTVVSGSFSGPGLIRHLYAEVAGTGSAQRGLSLFYSEDSSGAQASGAVGNRPSGTAVFEPIGSAAALDTDNIPEHYSGALAIDSTDPIIDIPLFVLVPIFSSFFLKLSVAGGAAVANNNKGMVTLVTGPSLEALRALM